MNSDYEPYVEFKDLPDTTTPIDATNLNNLQSLMRQDIADNQSVPAGGTTGQVLSKASNTDYDITWSNPISAETIINLVYPVGSYYETSDANFDPNTAWGGTWVEDSAGLITVAQNIDDEDFKTIGETVGSKEHLITQSESYWNVQGINPTGGSGGVNGYLVAHNNRQTAMSLIQPSVVIKRWHRTA